MKSEITQHIQGVSMDDTKLLELAGIAAGEKYGKENNPIERGDLALRLAVKLRINVEFFNSSDTVFAQKPRDAIAEDEWLKSDPYAATRRAIVRAAAAIGEAMQ